MRKVLQTFLICLSLSISVLFPASIVLGQDYFDSNRNLKIQNKPFFPIGIYSVDPMSFMQELADSGFNTVHSYNPDRYYLKRFLHNAEKARLMAFVYPGTYPRDKHYSPTRIFMGVSALKESPSLLAWQLSDEPELNSVSPSDLLKLRQQISQADPAHPLAVIISDSSQFKDYASVSDIMIVDPYPVSKGPLTQVSVTIEKARAAVNDKKPVWAIIQAFGYQSGKYPGWGWGREPTFEEERCMTYLAIVHGAQGIFYYTYHGSQYFIVLSPEHWKDVKRIAGELRDLTPVLLAPVTKSKLQIDISPADVGKDDKGASAIHYLMKELDGKFYLIAVNVLSLPFTATFAELPARPDKLEVLFENREIGFSGGRFSDEFAPYAVHVYSWR